MGAERAPGRNILRHVSVMSDRPSGMHEFLRNGVVAMESVAISVFAGVDTHKDAHVLCVLDSLGRRVRAASFPATAGGYRELARAIGDPALCVAVGVEGACSFGAGLTSHLAAEGYEVREVLRPKRDRRRRGSQKNDFVDAERAARAVAAGDGVSIPKSRDGWAEAARPALRAREILVRTQTQTMNAAKALISTAPEPIRARYSGLSGGNLMKSLKRRRPAAGDVLADTLLASLSALAATRLDAESRAAEPGARMESVVRDRAPAMPGIEGCCALSAVELGVAAGDNPGRMRSEASFAMLCGASPIEASSGGTAGYRLNRGGNRRANRALHGIAIGRMCSDERTGRYIARRMSEGKSKREAMRCLKRYMAREAYRALLAPTARRHADGALLAARRKRLGVLQREVAGELGIRVETVSAIETERVKHFEARGAYEALLDSLENTVNYD